MSLNCWLNFFVLFARDGTYSVVNRIRRQAMDNIYADIAARTGGNIYIGVVGPVRTGKSTFVKKFMELAIIPNIDNEFIEACAIMQGQRLFPF